MNPAPKTSRGALVYVTLGVAVLILALAFMIADARALNEAWRFYVLSQRGRPVVGVIEGLKIETVGRACAQHHVRYTFIVSSETRIEAHIIHGDEVVSETLFKARHMGEILPIIYDPTNSKVHLINFANRIRAETPFQVWKHVNDQGRCPTGASLVQ